MATAYPLSRDFRLRFADLGHVAVGVKRPECVLALSDGQVVCSHGDGGYSVAGRDGSLRHVVRANSGGRRFLPNGIALGLRGEVLFAHLGVNDGGVFSISGSGDVEALIESIEGRPMPPTNFVSVSETGGIWFTVSTRQIPRSLAWNRLVADGFIGYHDSRGTRILADGMGYTNEIAFSPDGKWVYANETYAQRVTRFELKADGSLGEKEIVAQLGGADLPDGLTIDAHDGLWVTCIGSNRLLVIRPDGEIQVILDEPDEAHSKKVARGIELANLTWEDMQGPPGDAPLGNVSSLAFGGPGQKTGYLGSLTSDRIWTFDSPVAGARTSNYARSVI